MSDLLKKINIFSKNSDPFSDQSVNRKHQPDYRIVLLMLGLMLVGLVVIYAIGPARANVLNTIYGTDYSSTYFFTKQLVSLVLAIAIFVIVSRVPYKWLLSKATTVLTMSLIACLVLAVGGWAGLDIVQCSLGACRWFDLGVLGTFQPAELVKFGLVLFLAGFLAAKIRMNKLDDKNETLLPLVVLISIILFLIIIVQKDMGTGIALMGIVASMLVISGMKYKTLLSLGAVAAVAMIVMIAIAPHRIERVATFLFGSNSSASDTYHIEHAMIALGSGGFAGLGVGNSVQATGYLPEAINDSVFAIIGEVFGFLGVVVLLTIFYLLLIRLVKTTDYLSDMRLKLIVAGVVGWIGTHIVLNVSSMIGLTPLTGITLPLLSFGGTSLFFIAAALGLVFQLSSYTLHPSRLKEANNEGTDSRRRFRRSRHTRNSRNSRA